MNNDKNTLVYEAMYKGKAITLEADSTYHAQLKAAAIFRARKSYDVDVYLISKNGVEVVHTPTF